MRYEVWELRSRSQIAAYDDEEQALDLVRRLLADGWATGDLIVGAEDEAIDVDDLPPTLTGEALAARLIGPERRQAQRSA